MSHDDGHGRFDGRRSFLKHFSVGRKLSVGFALLMSIFLLLGASTIWSLRRVEDQSGRLSRGYVPEVTLAQLAERQILYAMYGMRGFALSGDDARLAEARTAIAQAVEAIAEIEALARTNEDLLVLQTNIPLMESELSAYERLVGKTVDRRRAIAETELGLDGVGRTLVTSSDDYLASQRALLGEELARNASGETLRTRIEKIDRVDEVKERVRNLRILLWRAVARHRSEDASSLLERFAALAQPVEALGAASIREDHRRALKAVGTQIGAYASLMRRYLEELRALDALNDERDLRGRRLLDLAKALSDKGLQHSAKVAKAALDMAEFTERVLAFGLLLALLLSSVLAWMLTRDLTRGMAEVVGWTGRIAEGRLDGTIIPDGSDEVADLTDAVRRMQEALKAARDEEERSSWTKSALARINDVMRGEPTRQVLAERVLAELAETLDAGLAAFFVHDEQEGVLRLLASWAYTRRKDVSNRFELGNGLVGQAALERRQILLHPVPPDYLPVRSGLGERVPDTVCVTPILHDGRLKGVLELGTFGALDDRHLELLRQALPAVAITLEGVENREQLQRALETTQRQSEELQAQQEELEASNEELEEQTQALRASEEELRAQQEEMEVVNEELESKNQALSKQKREVERASRDLERKARELAQASRYKSEFLANMSHELRTPLNSLLLLAASLLENGSGNLESDQIEALEVIRGSGNDLLNLINEILDLAKIEAGRMTLHPETVRCDELARQLERSFSPVAKERCLELVVAIDDGAPPSVETDRARLEQILRNLLSNAFKFTEAGRVELRFSAPPPGGLPPNGTEEPGLAIHVRDTGIGIPEEELQNVFEAFQQVDGGITRRHGGTGLGLSISRELAALLGGRIELASALGKGSTFTLLLPASCPDRPGRADRSTPSGPPVRAAGAKGTAPAPMSVQHATAQPRHGTRPAGVSSPEDDRHDLSEGIPVALVVEDDERFSEILRDRCRKKGFRTLVCTSAEEALELLAGTVPDAILLDLNLPGMGGLSFLGIVKDSPSLRHVPVHVISAEDGVQESLRRGAIGHLVKPVDGDALERVFQRIEEVRRSEVKKVLLVDDDEATLEATAELIRGDRTQVRTVRTGSEALALLEKERFDCIVLDLGLDDLDGADLLRQAAAEVDPLPPVIVYTARDLMPDEERRLREHAQTIVLKDARAQERLLDEVSLFLHQVVSELPEPQKRIITRLHDGDALLRDKRILVVDDDMRTVFALARLLQQHGMVALKAENGAKALKILAEEPKIDLVLMDVMMPVMDGFEAMRRIRQDPKTRDLPILALTAKALPEDREHCIAAGANDYLAKPVNDQKLLSLLRVWLYETGRTA